MNDDLSIIAEIEKSSLAGWPAIEEEEYDDWVLRASSGYTGRANAIVPLKPGKIAIEEKLNYCELWYKRRGLPAVFKLTKSSDFITPYLDIREYGSRPPVNVQLLDLNRLTTNVDIVPLMLSVDEWNEAYQRITNQSDVNLAIHASLLNRIKQDTDFAVIMLNDNPVSCGICVYHDKYAGIFDIYTSPESRRHGYAGNIVDYFNNTSKDRGIQYTYLQVIADNLPAVTLYDKIGFQTKYQYWYRNQLKVD